jgi:tetratricopeptide (TPR) repeat protein
MRRLLLLCILALALPQGARATVLKSNIPGAHYKANPSAQTELTRVKSRLQLNNLSGALEAARNAVRRDSLAGEVYDVLGTLALRSGKYHIARDAFEQAAALAPEQAPVWNRLAQVSIMQLGLEEQGLQALKYAFAADSSFATPYYTEFMYHWARGEFDEAKASIEHAREIEPDESKSLLWYSAQLGFDMTQGDYGASERALGIHLGQVSNDITARQLMVQAQRGAGNAKGANENIHVLLALDPRQPLWLSDAGLIKRALGDRDSALTFFRLAVRADSGSFDAGYNLALEQLARKDTTAALRELRRLRGMDPNNWLVPLLASRVARAQGDTARATLAFDEARRLNPAMGLSRMARAGAAPQLPTWSSPELEAAEDLMEKGEFALAGDKLYQAARDKERKGAALYWLSRVTRISGGTGMPVITAQAAAEATNGDPVVVRALAEAEFAIGDAQRAIANLQTVRKAAPDDLAATAIEAEARYAIGDIAGARAVFNEAAGEPTRSYRLEAIRAAVFAAAKDAGASIARQRAAAVDYLPAGS